MSDCRFCAADIVSCCRFVFPDECSIGSGLNSVLVPDECSLTSGRLHHYLPVVALLLPAYCTLLSRWMYYWFPLIALLVPKTLVLFRMTALLFPDECILVVGWLYYFVSAWLHLIVDLCDPTEYLSFYLQWSMISCDLEQYCRLHIVSFDASYRPSLILPKVLSALVCVSLKWFIQGFSKAKT